MSESRPALQQVDPVDPDDLSEKDEAADIQAALHVLIARSTHPLVRACLEQCLEDIGRLTSCA